MDSKIIYKLMVDNNPDEAIKQLIYFDKRAIEQDLKYDILKSEKEDLERYTKRLQKENVRLNNIINKTIDYIKDNPKLINDKLYKNDQDTSFVFINTKFKLDLLDILEGE